MSKPVPLLYLIDCLEFIAGTEKHLYNLLRELNKTRFKPFVIAFHGSDELKDNIEKMGIAVRILNMDKIYSLKSLRLLFYLKRVIKKEKIKIMQTFHTNPDIYGTVLAKLSSIPVVISSRRDMGFNRNWRHILCYKFMNNFVDKVICVSEAVKKLIMREEGIPERKIRIIYNGIDPDEFSNSINVDDEKKKLGLAGSVPIIGMLANFGHIKGHRYLLEAAALLKSKNYLLNFILIGKGSLENDSKKQSNELGVAGMVHFLGHRADIQKMLMVMDILVVPSLSEGFSNTIVEALYMKKPVIATAVGGNPEIIYHNRTGILIPPKSPEHIARAIINLLNNRNFAKKLGESGRKSVEDNFIFKNKVKETEQLYETLLAEKRVSL